MDEALVLIDEDGTCYALPRATLERYRVADAQKAAVDALLGEEVVGYLMEQNTYAMEQLVRTYQAEKRQEGARERLAHAARHSADASVVGPATAAPGRGRRLLAWFLHWGRTQQPRTTETEP
jgi:hypothetical protein